MPTDPDTFYKPVGWEKKLDPRILNFLKKTDIIFEPYDALDLHEILKLRAEKALRKDKVSLSALKKWLPLRHGKPMMHGRLWNW